MSADSKNSEKLTSEVICLKLPTYFENMSSTRIRTNVCENKDIADLVEPVVQNYIYEKGLYTMDPIYKRAARIRAVDTIRSDEPDSALLQEINESFGLQELNESFNLQKHNESLNLQKLNESFNLQKHNESVNLQKRSGGVCRSIILRDEDHESRICGGVLYHDLYPGELLQRCKNIDLAADIRNRISGRTCVITGIFGEQDAYHDDRLTALNETLELCQEDGYSYAICFDMEEYRNLLLPFGFLPLSHMPGCFLLDMHCPLVLFFDTPSFIKDQFLDDPLIREVLWKSHLKLRLEIAGLFPGSLVLCFDSEIMNHRLIQKIVDCNPIPEVQYSMKILGEKICVPYGKILKGMLVPQCVTKDLNTEKLYDIDMERFEIREFPKYAPLDVQIRTIKSFMRPVILVDDLYHKGHRLQAVHQVMQKEGAVLDRLIVGVCSGRGRDLASTLEEPIDSIYFVPNMRSWLIESDLYPFIGGDGIRVKEQISSSPSLPSVNSILPYQFPSFMQGASMEAFYRMSGVCLENARNIFLVLEKLYQKQYHRKLTMSRIGEVLAEPRHPDTCILDTSVVQDSPSLLLEREMQKLRRLKHLLDGQFRM